MSEKDTVTPPAPKASPKKRATPVAPEGSAARKAQLLRGEIKE